MIPIQADEVIKAYQSIAYKPSFYLFLHPEQKTCCPLSALFLSRQPKKDHHLLYKRIQKQPIICEDLFAHAFNQPIDFIRGFIHGFDQETLDDFEINDFIQYEKGFHNGSSIRKIIMIHYLEGSKS